MTNECWFYLKNGVLWKHVENDGVSFLKKKYAQDVALCSVDEAQVKYPYELKKARLNESSSAVA